MTSPPIPFIKPCLAEATDAAPSGADWVHEIKYDGYRVQAHVAGSKVTLFTRNALDWTGKFGRVVGELEKLRASSAVLDCEAVVQNDKGVADLDALRRELEHGPKANIVLMVFDLMHLDGVDVRQRPLLQRKALLQERLGAKSKSFLLQFSDHMQGDGKDIFASACGMGLEGIVSKRIDRPYRSGRSGDWLKIKCVMADRFVVVGYVALKGASQAIGALVLAYHDGGALIYAGRVGTGFSAVDAGAIWGALQTIRTEIFPFSQRLTREQREGVVWVQPVVVAEIEYRGWSPDGLLRHCAFKAFRQDKSPDQICRPASLASRMDTGDADA
jgi:bifunctional non-homologous end joining protein LigD